MLTHLILLKIFEGNNDRHTVVSHFLIPRITAQFVRIYPYKYHEFGCLRVEYYGCAVGKETIVTSVPRQIAIEYQFIEIILIIVIYVLIPTETAISVDVSWPLITTPQLQKSEHCEIHLHCFGQRKLL